ncbi:MAG: hypothetical protein ACJ0S4_08285 [Candidatus Rariloculaceae bacterium]
MRVSILLATLVVVFSPGIGLTQEWIEYANLTDQFTINFAGDPEITETTYLSEYRALLPARVYTANYGPNRYSVTVVDYTDAERLLRERDSRTRGDDLPGDILGAVDYAAWNIRKRGGELTYDSWAAYDRIAGHQLHITNGDQTRTYAGIFRHVRRLYIVEATVSINSPPPVLFQQSLGILDVEGRRIRYEFYSDDNGEIQKNRVETGERWVGDPPSLTLHPR